jgi:uncharacterized membrane protein
MLKRLIPAAAVRELVLCLACLSWCVIAYYGRGYLLGETRWHFMGWNLFLAVVPFGLSFAMRYWLGWIGRGLLALPWLLFLPNAPYVATDIIHLTNKSTASPWHDLLFLLSCAASGMVLGYLSLRHVHEIVEETTNRWIAWLTVSSVLTLSSFGIYLGRFLRWNSWDLATQPKSLLIDIGHRFLEPQHYTKAWAFTMALTVMLGLGYGTLEILRAPTNKFLKPGV